MLKIENIDFSYGASKILFQLSMLANEGSVTCILGRNGVGKSTIFNIIIGLLKPNYGSIFIEGKNVINEPIFSRTKRYKIGYVPQHGGYFNDLTLFENLKAIGEILISEEKERETKINILISKFELDAVRNIKAKYLSGGQKKKLVIALALLGDPKVLLLDECFAALDVLTIKMLQQIIVNLQTENNIGICICDHQARDLLSCVDVAIVLSNGKVIAKGTPSELVKNPNAQTAYFGDSFKFN